MKHEANPYNPAREATKNRTGLVAALDIGTNKVSCLIAHKEAERPARIVGIGHHVSRGVKAGAIVDMDEAEQTVRSAVEAAEQMAGQNISAVSVGLSGTCFQSRLISYDIAISGHEIGDNELRSILDPERLGREVSEDREIVHTIPVGYSIDGNRGVRDPRGMFGDRLGINLHIVTASKNTLKNLDTCIQRCHLEIENRVVAPYASALSALVGDEMRLGVTLIDMGGGSTNIAVFFDGELVHVDSVPVGGHNVTNDIARGLSTPVAHAERMKTLYGSALPTPSDDHEIIKVPLIGEEQTGETNLVPRSMLVGIIRPRIEETFEMVQARLESAGFDKVTGPRLVLTGGASMLPGVRELAGELLQKQVRMAKPRPIDGLAEAASGPAFSTCAGLLEHALKPPHLGLGKAYRPEARPSGRLGRISQWFRENF